jgi:thiol-disulfide isomerase/thioredoxin
MNEKVRFSLLLLAFVPLFVFSNPKEKFVIRGTVKGLKTGTVEVAYLNQNGDDTTVTSAIVSGRFTLTGQVPEPGLARFSLHGVWTYSVSFFLENANINFHLINGFDDSTKISGSASNIVYQQLEPHQINFFAQAQQYDAAREQAQRDHNITLEKNADSIWTFQQQQWMHMIRSSITKEPGNYASLYFIKWLLFHPSDYDAILSLFMTLAPEVRSGLAGKEFLADFGHSRRTALGQPAPEISGVDTSGRPQTLAMLKSEVVLLDFWASYCARCRQENPQLKAVYEKYHAWGFEILSFSLDYQRDAWINAIQHDKMNWPQASELRAGASASAGVYDVSDMPRNFLIDRKGNIIAKDLSVADLNAKLQEMMGEKGN